MERIAEEARLFVLAEQHAPAKVSSSFFPPAGEKCAKVCKSVVLGAYNVAWCIQLPLLMQVWKYYSTLLGGNSRQVRQENQSVVSALVKGTAVREESTPTL